MNARWTGASGTDSPGRPASAAPRRTAPDPAKGAVPGSPGRTAPDSPGRTASAPARRAAPGSPDSPGPPGRTDPGAPGPAASAASAVADERRRAWSASP